MAGPWEDYSQPAADAGPWSDYTPAKATKKEEPGLVSALKRTGGQMASAAGITGEDIFGANAATEGLQSFGKRVQQENPAGITQAADIIDRPGQWVKESVGNMAAQMGPQIAGGIAGRVLGGLAGGLAGSALPGPGTIAGAAAGQELGGRIGQALPTLIQEYGGIREQQKQEGIDEKGRALAAAVPATAIEFALGPQRLVGKLLEGALPAAYKEAAKGGAKEIAKFVGKEGLKQGIGEASEEIPQNLLEEWGAKGNNPLTSPESWKDAGFSALMALPGGAIMGGGASGVGIAQAAKANRLDAEQAKANPPTADQDQNAALATYGAAADQYTGMPNDVLALPAPSNPDVIIVPNQDGSQTSVDRNDGPISAGLVETGIVGMLKSQSLLPAYATQEDAYAAMAQRPDADQMEIVPHPRQPNGFAVVQKSPQVIAAQRQQQAIQQQLAQEEDARVTQRTDLQKQYLELTQQASKVERSINANTSPEDAAIAREQASELRQQAQAARTELTRLSTQAATQNAARAQQTLSAMPSSPEGRMATEQMLEQERAQAELQPTQENANAATLARASRQGRGNLGAGSQGNPPAVPNLNGGAGTSAGTPVGRSGTVEPVGTAGVANGAVGEADEAALPVKMVNATSANSLLQRDDLVGAIMRVTGGKGIASNMAQTITGDKAGSALAKVRGLFRNDGQMDLDDLAELLRLEEGYDVRDGNQLADLIREQAAGNPVYSMERTEREAAVNAEKEYKNAVNRRAEELGLKKVGGKRTLAMVEADIARVEQERADMEAKEERAAIQAENAAAEAFVADDAPMSEADFRAYFAQAASIEYTQEEIDRAEQERTNRENARTEAATLAAAEEQAQGRAGKRNQDGQAEEGTRGSAEAGLTLTGQTNTEAAQEYARQQADANRQDTEPAGPTVTADQVDMFNTQGGLFNSNREANQKAGPFGPIFTEYRHDAKGAIKKLSSLKNGEAIAALSHKDIGDIDLVWGEEGTNEDNGFGLSKLIKYHPEVLGDLQQILDSMAVVKRSKNRIQLESEDHKAAVRLEWDGVAKNWLLTAFEKKGKSRTDTRTDTADVVVADDTARRNSALDSTIAQPKSGEAVNQDETPKPATIADFGERIAGAKKDLWQTYQKAMSDELPADAKDITLAKHFPEPDYENLIASGMDLRAVAAIKAMRDEIPSKPRVSYRLKRWADTLKMLRDFSNQLISGKASIDAVLAEMRKLRGTSDVANAIELYAELGYPAFKQASGYKVSDGWNTDFDQTGNPRKKNAWGVTNSRGELTIYDSREKAIEGLLAKLQVAPERTGRSIKLDIYKVTRTGDIVIGKKVASNKYIDLKTGFKTTREARQYLADNEAELLKLLEQKKQVPPTRRSTNDPRVGKDYRQGEDITPEKFAAEFGFRGVQFGNYVEQGRRQKDLNNAYDALLDLANTLGVPPRAISLNGSLGLAFGARGSGGVDPASAHYEPIETVINLTKINGAGSLGHEFFHALDNYFSKQRGQADGYLTAAPYERGAGVRPEVVKAFADLMKAIKASDFAKRSGQMDQKRTKDYWGTDIEMAARAFESYLIAKGKAKGESNDYLANIVSEEAHDAFNSMLRDSGSTTEPYPYPTKAEQREINKAFDALFSVLETKETDKGIELREEQAVYNVSEANGITGDLFQGTENALPETKRNVLPRPRKGAAGNVSDAAGQATAVLAVREAPDTPGLYRVNAQLVSVGARNLPVAKVNSPADAAQAFAYLSRYAVEHFDALVTDKNGKPLAIIGSFKGAQAQTSVYPETVMMELARIEGAANLWLSHNHPSGIAELSGADRNLATAFANILRDSSVTFRGLSAMARKGNTVEWTDTDYNNGSVTLDRPTPHAIPIVERELINNEPGEAVSSPTVARTLVKDLAKDKPGIVFLNAQNQLAAFVPFDPAEMSKLREGDRLMRLFRAAAKANGSGAIVAMPDGKVTAAQFANLKGALGTIQVRTLDGIQYQSNGTGVTESLAEKGLDNSAGPNFLSVGNAEGPRISQTQAEVRLKEMLGDTLGRVLLDSGIITLERAGSQYQGATYRDGTFSLNLDSLTEGNFDGVLLHEGFHATVRDLLGEAKYKQLMQRLESGLKLAKGSAWLNEAKAAVPADTNPADITEEMAAYAVEQVVNGAKTPGFIQRWVQEFLSAIRAAVIRYAKADGKLQAWAMKNLKPEDLARLAVSGLRAKAMGAMQGQMRETMAYSVADNRTMLKPGLDRLRRVVQAYQNNTPFSSQWIQFGNTPAVLQMLGAKNLPIELDPKKLSDVAKPGKKHSLSEEAIVGAVEHLGDPVAVLESHTENGALVVLTEAIDNGRPVVVAIHLNNEQGKYAINKVASIYAKDDVAGLVSATRAKGKKILYVNNEKRQLNGQIARLYSPLSPSNLAGVDYKVLNENDLVKYEGGTRYSNPDIRYSTARRQDLEALFNDLGKRGLAKSRANEQLQSNPDGERIRYVQDNFLDILSSLEDAGLIGINCN